MPSHIQQFKKLLSEVDHAPDLNAALKLIVESLSQLMQAKVCSVYLVMEHELSPASLLLKANVGFSEKVVNEVELSIGEGLVGRVAERAEVINLDDASAHKQFHSVDEIDELAFQGFLGVPIVEHGEVLGVIVLQKEQHRFSDEHEAFLITLASRLTAAILHAKNEGEFQQKRETQSESVVLHGVAGSPGISIGQAVLLFERNHLSSVQNKPSRGEAVEKALLDKVLKQVIDELAEQANIMKHTLTEAELSLFTVYGQMLEGGALVEEAYINIRNGSWAPLAWRDSVETHAQIFETMEDEYLAERAQDVRDLGKRVLNTLVGSKDELLSYPDNVVLVGENISVTDLARVPQGHLKGIVSGHGSKSSHVAILAHGLGVPAVMGVSNIPRRGIDGTSIVVDGYSGQVYVDPDADLFETLQQSINEEDEILQKLDNLLAEPATTTDGVTVSVYVNSGLMADLSPAVSSHSDGVGLYRTEIPFQVRDRFPSEAEQYELYYQLLKQFKGKPVVLRTLDVGGDKPLSYFPIEEDNPFLGWRGIRITLDHPEIFITQVRAMLWANVDSQNLRILLPMVTNRVELDDALILIHRAKNELEEEHECEVPFPQVGVMIEVPAAVYQIEELCQLVDFVSIGTNDLTQYLLAVDRNNENVAGLYSSLHPAVIKALRQIVTGAMKQNTPVSVCGEMAGDAMGALILLGLGVENLSMSVGSIGRVKETIRHFSLLEAHQLVEQALELADPDDIQDLLIEAINGKGLGGLIRPGQ